MGYDADAAGAALAAASGFGGSGFFAAGLAGTGLAGEGLVGVAKDWARPLALSAPKPAAPAPAPATRRHCGSRFAPLLASNWTGKIATANRCGSIGRRRRIKITSAQGGSLRAASFQARQPAISSLVGKRPVAFFENANRPSTRISNTPPLDRRRLTCAEGRSLRSVSPPHGRAVHSLIDRSIRSRSS